MNNKEHTLLCIMAESSAGKDFLTNQLCAREGYRQLISYTTRPRRQGEGETHIFVTEDEYVQMLEEEQVAAHTIINGYHYWCTIDQLTSVDIYIIDPAGVKTLKELNIPNLRLVTIYINVPEDIRRERAKKRGDNMDIYRSRSISERDQFRNMKKNMDVDYVVSNIDFSKAYMILKRIATVEGLWKNHTEDKTE